MKHFAMPPFSVLVPLFVLVVTAGCGSVGNGEKDGGNNNNNNNNNSLYALCSNANKCPAGQFCFNGLCAPGCNANPDCASDQYCDTADLGPPFFCKNKVVQSCPTVSCAQSQECREGLCSAKAEVGSGSGSSACIPRSDLNDSCDKYSVCIDGDDNGPEQAACYAFPPCPENGACPVGVVGAVCNEKDIPSKGRFCMSGVCKAASHCPTDWKCVRPTSNQVLGFCSSGGPNQLCFSNADCMCNLCNQFGGPSFPGFCQ